VEVTGAPGLKTGAPCVLRAMPNGKQSDCIAEVACGTAILWPRAEPVQCTYDGARPTGVSAEGAGHSLTLDDATLTLKTKTVTATIALDAP
jgi:hypothetical protein